MNANANKTAFLKLLNDAEPHTYAVDAVQEVVIGRESNCQVVLDSAKYGGVSRRHAMIRYRPESLSFEISDLGSSNGTFVNGERIFTSQLLRSGDQIRLGSNSVLFNFDDPSLPPTVMREASPSPVPIGMGNANAAAVPALSSPVPSPDSSPLATASRQKTIGKGAAIAAGSLLLVLAVLGGGKVLSDRSPSKPPSNAAPTTGEQSPAASDSASTASAKRQSVADPNGLFQVDLPTGYETEVCADGINLTSADGSFQGAITAVRTPQQFTAEQLIQGFTDQQNGNSNLQNFTIQDTETINEGVRIDWVARLTSVDSDLDAVTHFLQQGEVVVEIDLFSVDRPFSQQDADEANVILRSLRINP